MAIAFKNVKSTVLGLQDTIRVGKLSGCRVCDVIPDHYEYLIWADKQGILKFTGIVIETIKEHAGFAAQRRHYEEEIAPYMTQESRDEINALTESISRGDYCDTFEDDVPF